MGGEYNSMELDWEFKIDNAYHLAAITIAFFNSAFVVFLRKTESTSINNSRTNLMTWILLQATVPLTVVNLCVTRWSEQALQDVACANAVMFTFGALCFLWELIQICSPCLKQSCKPAVSTTTNALLLFITNAYWADIFYSLRFRSEQIIEEDNLTIVAFVLIGLFFLNAIYDCNSTEPDTPYRSGSIDYENRSKVIDEAGGDETDNEMYSSTETDEYSKQNHVRNGDIEGEPNSDTSTATSEYNGNSSDTETSY